MIVVVASIKGAPGVTTTATALAESWPSGRRILLVEVDPFGGDLAAWFGVQLCLLNRTLTSPESRKLPGLPGMVFHRHTPLFRRLLVYG